MFIEAKDGGSGGDNWGSCKAPVKSSPQTNQHKPTSFFTGRMPFLSPNQQCQSTEGISMEALMSRIPPKNQNDITKTTIIITIICTYTITVQYFVPMEPCHYSTCFDSDMTRAQIPVQSCVFSRYVIGLISQAKTEGSPMHSLNCDGNNLKRTGKIY